MKHANLTFSCNKFQKEKGRYTKTPLEKRLCDVCKEIEDEEHFLIDYKKYIQERESMLNFIDMHCPNFITLTSNNK